MARITPSINRADRAASQPLTRQRLAASAFRTLGLSAEATQADIDAAARRLRLFSDSAAESPKAADLACLGPLLRSRSDIEQAVSRLAEPLSRLDERLLWFNDPADLPRSDSIADLWAWAEHGSNSAPPRQAKDRIVAGLVAAVLSDSAPFMTAQWQGVLERCGRVAADPAQLDHFVSVELNGDFEKRAGSSEIASALQQLPRLAEIALVDRVNRALEKNDLRACTGAIKLLAASSDEQSHAWMLDRLEDEVVRRANGMYDTLLFRLQNRAPRNNSRILRRIWTRSAACRDAASTLKRDIQPIASLLISGDGKQSAIGADVDRQQRVRHATARAIAILSRGWLLAADKSRAKKCLTAANKMAADPHVQAKILADYLATVDRIKGSRRRKGMPIGLWIVIILCSSLGRIFLNDRTESQDKSPITFPRIDAPTVIPGNWRNPNPNSPQPFGGRVPQIPSPPDYHPPHPGSGRYDPAAPPGNGVNIGGQGQSFPRSGGPGR